MIKLEKTNSWIEKNKLKLSIFFVFIWSYFIYKSVTTHECFYQDYHFYASLILFGIDSVTIYHELKKRKKSKNIIDKS